MDNIRLVYLSSSNEDKNVHIFQLKKLCFLFLILLLSEYQLIILHHFQNLLDIKKLRDKYNHFHFYIIGFYLKISEIIYHIGNFLEDY